jgi:hypothetical protein
MKNCLLIVFFISSLLLLSNTICAQQPNKSVTDTTKKVNTPVKPAKKDTLIETGVAVSPSTLRFNVKPGTLQTKTIRVSNDTRKKMAFQILFQDYAVSDDGDNDVPKSKYEMYSLSKYILVSPTLIELNPRESKNISVTVDIPPGDSMAISMWTMMEIDQLLDREKLELPDLSKNTIGMGVKNSFGFGISIFQNPPNVIVSNVEIIDFKFNKKTDKSPSEIFTKVKNMGSGISYSLYYLELTNLVTGKVTKMKVKQFPIFPGYKKDFSTKLPDDLEKGPYSVMAVLDFGNKEELQTAELEFTIE